MGIVLKTLEDTVLYILHTLLHNSPALLIGILVAAIIQVYIDPAKMNGWLMRRSSVSIPATVAFGAFTPFCACGTMAVVLAMLATSLPWGPVMAFLTSSPLMSPEEFVMMSGILGPMFAVALAVASVLIGLGSGYATHIIEKKTHFLDGQLRLAPANGAEQEAACSCEQTSSGCSESENACGCGANAPAKPVAAPLAVWISKHKIDRVWKAAFEVGAKKILPLFTLFAAIGYLINQIIPTTWISALFGAHNVFAVPLAALIGLPLYVNGDSSIPLVQTLMQSGVSGGAMLAFMITGPGTSAGVLAGIATIMKKKAIALYTVYLLVGATVLGYAYNVILMFLGK